MFRVANKELPEFTPKTDWQCLLQRKRHNGSWFIEGKLDIQKQKNYTAKYGKTNFLYVSRF